MQKNSYLDELGVPAEKQYANMYSGNDLLQSFWAKQREEFGFDERETYDLEHCFVEWLYCHLRMYKERISKEQYNFNLLCMITVGEGDPITLSQAIDYILERLEKALNNMYDKVANWTYVRKDKKLAEGIKEAMLMWAEIAPYCD